MVSFTLGNSTTEFGKFLSNTYNVWKAKKCSTYLAIVKETRNRNVDEHTIVIGNRAENTTGGGYMNGELDAKGSYR